MEQKRRQPLIAEDAGGNILAMGVLYSESNVQLTWRRSLGWTGEQHQSLTNLFGIEEGVRAIRLVTELPYPPVQRDELTEDSPIAAVQKALGDCTASHARRFRKQQGWRTYRKLEAEKTFKAVQACKRRGLTQRRTAQQLSLSIASVGIHWHTPTEKQERKESKILWAAWTGTVEAHHYLMSRNAHLGIALCEEIERQIAGVRVRKGERPPRSIQKAADATGISADDVSRWMWTADAKKAKLLKAWLSLHPPAQQPPYFDRLVSLLGGEEALHQRIPFVLYEEDYWQYTPQVYTRWNLTWREKQSYLPPREKDLKRMQEEWRARKERAAQRAAQR